MPAPWSDEINELCALLDRYYFDASVAAATKARLRDRLAAGAYRDIAGD